MAKKKTQIPKYGTITLKGIQYYRTRITDADGKELSLYAATCEELYEKQLEARKQVEEIIFHRQHPTVAEYGEKWLLMQSAKVSASTLRGYTRDMTNYIIKPLGEMYMEEVTADDIRLALVPLSKKSEGLYNKVNMLLKCIFYTAERNQILEHNPCAGISGKGGKPTKKKEALTDQQVAVLLDTVKGLPPYLFTPTLGMTQKNQPKIKYTLDFDVTPHQLRHTYITNLLYAGVDPKTVQYLAGHENSKTTMDIYAKVKYNKPEELFGVVNGAFYQPVAE